MRNLHYLILLTIPSILFSQVKWMTIEEAIQAQQTTPKKIIIDFYADWCAPCKKMELETYNHPVVSDYLNNNYYAVKFNAEEKKTIEFKGRIFANSDAKKLSSKNPLHEFTKFMNINAIPSTVFLDEKGDPITILQGALTAKELEPYLPFFAKDIFRKIKTKAEWENYQKKFKSKIKD